MGSLKTYLYGAASAIVIFLIIFKILRNVLIRYSAVGVDKVFETTVEKIGTLLVTEHILAFEVTSVLLLGALVGAAIIARPGKIEKEIEG